MLIILGLMLLIVVLVSCQLFLGARPPASAVLYGGPADTAVYYIMTVSIISYQTN